MNEQRLRMPVEGMTCESCNRHVERALAASGARDVHADYRNGEAVFTVDRGTAVAPLAQGVAAVGYRPGTVEVLSDGPAGAPAEAPVDVRLPAPQRPRVAKGADDGYDLAIIGSGSAAFAAAIKARDAGARVVMVERGTLGGTCVNTGCVPSKALLRAAEAYWQTQHHRFAGFQAQVGPVDLRKLVAQKRELVDALRKEKYQDLIGVYGWEVRQGTATFADATTLHVDGATLQANAYLIATGASAAVPPIPGLAEAGYLTSTTALQLEAVPDSLAVIGANAIGLELGQLYRHLGSRVTLFEVLPRIAPFEEPEIGETLAEALQEEGMEVVPAAQIRRVGGGAEDKKQIVATVGGCERTWEVAEILVATGRRPNTKDLGLERAGIETDRRGAIVVDETLRTTNLRVWAAGDVTPAPQFVYVAAYEGALAAENSLNGADRRVDLRAVPRVTFTSPQIAAVGLTEAQAREQGHEVKVSVLPLHAVPRALVNRETHGLFKLVADAQTDRLLGAHILADNAGDVIHAATLALKFGLTIADLVGTFAPYLTMAEGLKLAAQTFDKDVAVLSCCAE
ncbi:MAG: mercury(II) reductase [Chloroflexi bacterium]|nr:mercury(II) reductase [Chloroflexota bacterium]